MTDALLPEIGDIHRAFITWTYVDGSFRQEAREVLILDAEHTPEGAYITWEFMGDNGTGYLPQSEPQRTLFPYLDWPAGAINWGRSETTAIFWMTLSEVVGTYKPRDPQLNSIDMLRDAARKRLLVLSDWAAGRPDKNPQGLRHGIRTTTEQINALPAQRDELIRRAIVAKVRVEDIAADSELSAARIYQIRDGRR